MQFNATNVLVIMQFNAIDPPAVTQFNATDPLGSRCWSVEAAYNLFPFWVLMQCHATDHIVVMQCHATEPHCSNAFQNSRSILLMQFDTQLHFMPTELDAQVICSNDASDNFVVMQSTVTDQLCSNAFHRY